MAGAGGGFPCEPPLVLFSLTPHVVRTVLLVVIDAVVGRRVVDAILNIADQTVTTRSCIGK